MLRFKRSLLNNKEMKLLSYPTTRSLSLYPCALRTGAPVDGLAAGAVPAGDVAALQHEVGDDPMEGTALVSEAGLARGDLTEVLCKVCAWRWNK